MHISVRHGVFYEELAKISKVNKRGGWNKWGRLANTAIRNFIVIKSSNDIVKISTKRTKKYKGSLST